MRKRKKAIEQIEKDIEVNRERIIKSKQAAATNSTARDKLMANVNSAGGGADADLVNEIDDEVKQLRVELDKLHDKVNVIQKS